MAASSGMSLFLYRAYISYVCLVHQTSLQERYVCHQPTDTIDALSLVKDSAERSGFASLARRPPQLHSPNIEGKSLSPPLIMKNPYPTLFLFLPLFEVKRSCPKMSYVLRYVSIVDCILHLQGLAIPVAMTVSRRARWENRDCGHEPGVSRVRWISGLPALGPSSGFPGD